MGYGQIQLTESEFGGGFILRTVLFVMSHLVCLFEQGMGDFLNEMATMMSQSKPIVSDLHLICSNCSQHC